MSEVNAIAALTSTYESLTPKLPTHWPNVQFTPPANAHWVQPHFIFNEGVAATNFADGLDLVTGVFQFDVYGPQGKGLKDFNAITMRLKNAFRVGTVHVYQGTEVTVVTCGKIEGFQTEAYWKEIVSGTLRFHQFRNP